MDLRIADTFGGAELIASTFPQTELPAKKQAIQPI